MRIRKRPSRTTLFLSLSLLVIVTLYLLSSSSSSLDSSDFSLHHNHPLPRQDFWRQNVWDLKLFQGDHTQVKFATDGLVRGWDGVHAKALSEGLTRQEVVWWNKEKNRHPIQDLIDVGRQRWDDLLARQSKTLPQAVIEYKRRYSRPPPRGFETWWQFCKEHNVQIVDDYDQINRDIEPYFVLSPETFRTRARRLYETPTTYQIHLLTNGSVSRTGDRAISSRGRLLTSLITPLAPLLPSDLTIHVSDHDLGSWLLADDQRIAIKTAIKEGRYMTEDELRPYEQRLGRVQVKGLASACPEDSPAWQRSLALQDGEAWVDNRTMETTFIHDPSTTYEFCTNPTLQTIHGSLSWDFPRETALRPIFQLSKFTRNAEFLTTPLEAYSNATSSSALAQYTPWDEKTVSKVFWRGTSTGDSYSRRDGYDWRLSHRPRLALMAQETEGQSEVWVQRGKEWDKEWWRNGKLNDVYMDVGLTGQPHQCKQEDGTCDEMAEEINFKGRVRPEDSKIYKYVLDVDGNGWSSRLHRLIMSGSMVIKSTIYPEWHSDWLIPWVHYVPTQIDYSDLYSILSFFAGPPDGRVGGHDHLAKQIADNGRKFALEHWRWEDMQAYMLRLLLEYVRLEADDRDAASYNKYE